MCCRGQLEREFEIKRVLLAVFSGGLGITPGKGAWRRVEGVVGLHNEQVSLRDDYKITIELTTNELL